MNKFKVWDRYDEELTEYVSLEWALGREIDDLNSLLKSDRFIFLQSTGLKDLNDREIFEGDVVEHSDGEYSFIGTATYSVFGFYVEGEDDNYKFEDFADENTMIADCTIVGNIYDTNS